MLAAIVRRQSDLKCAAMSPIAGNCKSLACPEIRNGKLRINDPEVRISLAIEERSWYTCPTCWWWLTSEIVVKPILTDNAQAAHPDVSNLQEAMASFCPDSNLNEGRLRVQVSNRTD